jgi:GrpB-like predicted nucleotidyltransferase (UPF0157 family)
MTDPAACRIRGCQTCIGLEPDGSRKPNGMRDGASLSGWTPRSRQLPAAERHFLKGSDVDWPQRHNPALDLLAVTDEVSNHNSTAANGVHAVILAEYDRTWPVAFHRESIRVLEASGGILVGVEHIGSTSVPGLAAKPIIDMLGEVDQMELNSAPLVPLLEPLGYLDRSAEFTDRLLFSGGSSAMTHNLHIVARGTTSLRNEILFRDRMRRDPKSALRYEALKRTLASRSYTDPHGYSRAKSDFIVTIIDEERDARGLPFVDIWATLGPVRRKGWVEIERTAPPGGPL